MKNVNSHRGETTRNITEVRCINAMKSTQMARGLDLQQAIEIADWSSRNMAVNNGIEANSMSNDLRDSENVTKGAGRMMYEADNSV